MFETNENISIEIKKCYDHFKGNDYGYIWRKIFIIDDFYQNPDAVRATAQAHVTKYEKEYCGNLIGGRVVETYPDMIDSLKPVFQNLCQHEQWYNLEYSQDEFDRKWNDMKFMVNVTSGEEIEKRFDEKKHTYTFHKDGVDSKWAALVYLNKEDEYEGGTTFYSWEGHPHSYPREEFFSEMKYNRMVLYEANQMHGALLKRGMFTSKPRLTQVFFM